MRQPMLANAICSVQAQYCLLMAVAGHLPLARDHTWSSQMLIAQLQSQSPLPSVRNLSGRAAVLVTKRRVRSARSHQVETGPTRSCNLLPTFLANICSNPASFWQSRIAADHKIQCGLHVYSMCIPGIPICSVVLLVIAQ